MPIRKIIRTPNAPQAGSIPLSQAVQVDHTLYVSGNLGMDPKTGQLVPGGIRAETEQALRNIQSIVHAAGSDMTKVVKVTMLLQDLSTFAEVNDVYRKFFNENPPARMAYQVVALPIKGALIEIECVAIVGDLVTVPAKL